MVIHLKTSRQDLEAANSYFVPYIKQWKVTNINNVKDSNMQSAEYLLAIAVNCLIDESCLHLQKKIINTTSQSIKIKFTIAQAVIFYRMLIVLPIPSIEFYLNKLRNDWIEQLDRQLIEQNIYQQPVQKAAIPATNSDFDFEYDE